MRKFEPGDRVVVARPPQKCLGDKGKAGTIAEFRDHPYYAVVLDGEDHESDWLGRELDKEEG